MPDVSILGKKHKKYFFSGICLFSYVLRRYIYPLPKTSVVHIFSFAEKLYIFFPSHKRFFSGYGPLKVFFMPSLRHTGRFTISTATPKKIFRRGVRTEIRLNVLYGQRWAFMYLLLMYGQAMTK